jgi:general secretion pathway protein K
VQIIKLQPTSSDTGFILLTSIWLLVLGGAIAAAIMLNARSAVREVKAAQQQALGNAALLSARDQVIADLIARGRFSRWAQANSTGSLTTADAQNIDMNVSQEGGRLDLLAAQKDKVDALFASLDLPNAVRQAARTSLEALRTEAQSGKRPLRSLLELHGLNGWTPELAACLLPLVTIHSGMPSPSPSAAPVALAQILSLQNVSEDGGAIDTISVAGELYRLTATAQIRQTTVRSSWVLRITGDLQKPYWGLATYPGGLPVSPPPSCFKQATPL